MDQKSKDWLIVGGLVILSLVPIFGGALRISHISAGDSNLENFRFMWPGWHRKAGRVLLVMGISVAATGLWMTMTYPIAMGAGTQVLTHLPWLLFPSIQGELSRFFAMTSGWVINIIVAEWIIRTSIEKKRQDHEL